MFVLVSPSFWGGPWPPMGKTQAPFPGAATTTFQGQATNPLPWIVVALVGLVLAARLFPAAAPEGRAPFLFFKFWSHFCPRTMPGMNVGPGMKREY